MRWKRGNRLKLLSEKEAPAQTRAIFDDVRHALGIAAVPFLYQVYAGYPAFLEQHWEAFRPAVESRQFSLLGDRLAAEAYTRAHNYFEVRDLSSRLALGLGDRPDAPSLKEVLDYYQYLDPRLLLIATAQVQALEGPVGQVQDAVQRTPLTGSLSAPLLVADTETPPAIHRIWEDRRRLIEIAFIAEEHRALAAWPAFYQEYWLALRPLVQSPLYQDCQYRIGESAWGMGRELPVRIETSIGSLLDAGLAEEEISSLARIHETIIHAMSGLVLDVVFARIGCEGGTSHPGHAPEQRPATEPETTGSTTRAA